MVSGEAPSSDDEVSVIEDILNLGRDIEGVLYRDVTWAFNQASGARWEASHTLDRMTPPPVAEDPEDQLYAINPDLPSLNRHGGTIYVPPGRYYIFGTIRLFAGQVLVGASPGADGEGGTELVKIGDGPCIEVVPAVQWTDTDELSVRDVMASFHEGKPRDPGDRVPKAVFGDPEGHRWTEAEREQAFRDVLLALAPVRISRLRITQLDLPSLGKTAPRLPVDILSALYKRPLFPREYDGRRDLIPFTSMGIRLVNTHLGIVEDVAVEGFRNGCGVYAEVASPNGSGYLGEILRTRVSSCHTGIFVARPYGPLFAKPRRDADGQLIAGGFDGTPTRASINDWLIDDVEVLDCTASGIDLWSASSRVVSSIIRAGEPAPRATCIRTLTNHHVIEACTLSTDGQHIEVLPESRFSRDGLPDQYRVTGGGSMHAWILQNEFTGADGDASDPTAGALELTRIRRRGEDLAPMPKRSLWSRSGASLVGGATVDTFGDDTSPPNTWTRHNLLANASLREGAPLLGGGPLPGWRSPEAWRWRRLEGAPNQRRTFLREPNPGFVDGPRAVPLERLLRPLLHATNSSPGFAGGAVSLKTQEQARQWEDGKLVQAVWLMQTLREQAPDGAEPSALQWAQFLRLRGHRLVASVWVRSESPGWSVRLGLRQQGAGAQRLHSRTYERIGEWQLLRVAMDPAKETADDEYETASPAARGLDLVVEVLEPDSVLDAPLEIASPQLVLGPHQLLTGPALLTLGGLGCEPVQVYGPLALRHGFVTEVPVRLPERADVATAFVGIDGDLEALVMGARDSRSDARVEICGTSGRHEIPITGGDVTTLAAPRPVCAEDRVRVVRTAGEGELQLMLSVRGSRVV